MPKEESMSVKSARTRTRTTKLDPGRRAHYRTMLGDLVTGYLQT
jgi:hypothetical protein